MLAALDEAAAGRGSVFLVEGAAGIGKSRFAEELADRAAGRGMAVHWGRCWEAGGAPAYWPWIQVLRSLLRGGVDGTRLGAQTSSVLAPLLPELGAGGGPEARELEPEQARFRLMDAAYGLLGAAGREQPALVVLEDLHAADPASVTMLDFVARQVRDEPLVVVGTFREAEAPREEIAEPLARVSRAAQAVLRLRALTLEEAAACVARIAGTEPGPRVAATIHEASEGNPLFVVEIAGLMASQGALDDDADRVDIMIPASIRAVIRERAAGLDGRTRRLLGAASVIGRDFTGSDLAELVEDEDLEPSLGLAEACGAGLVSGGDDGRHGFSHFLIREVFHADLEPERRASLHRRRADQLLRRRHAGTARPWAELAHHLLEAGPAAADRALEACEEAAAQAAEGLAFDDAAHFSKRAFELLERQPDPDPRRLCGLLLERARALLQAGAVEDGRRVCRRAADLARGLEDAGLLARAALTYGSVFVYADVDPTLVELLREALGAIDDGDSAVRAKLQARLAAALQPASDPATAFALARDAIAMARRAGDRAALLAAIRSGCSALMDLAPPEERLALNREHVALAGELERPVEALRAHMRIVIDALELGDLTAADGAIDACDELAERTGLPHHRWPVRSFRAMRAAMAGRFDDATDLIEQARRESERARDPNAPRTLELQRQGLLRAREAIDDAWPQPDLLAAPVVGGFEALYARMVAGSHLARHGRADEVPRSMLERAAELGLVMGDRSLLCLVADVAAGAGDAELARRLMDRLLPYASHCVTWGLFGMIWEGPVSRSLALLASTLGDAGQAERFFEDALTRARDIGALPATARTAYEFASHLAEAGGGSQRCRELLEEAEGIAGRLGQRGLLELIDELRSAVSADAPASSRTADDGVPTVAYFRLVREGELWLCECEGASFRLKDTKGVRMLARLVADPGREFHALDLSGAPPPGRAADGGDAGELLDDTARRQYRLRVEALQAELEEARGFHDPARAARAQEELDAIAAELSRAFGLGGRARREGRAAERARVNVRRRLRDAVDRIAEQCPAAGAHLEWALTTGMFCVYDPRHR